MVLVSKACSPLQQTTVLGLTPLGGHAFYCLEPNPPGSEGFDFQKNSGGKVGRG